MNRRERRAQWQATHRHAARHLSALPGRLPFVSDQAISAIRMQIGELVFRGFERRHASRIATAFERSLDVRLRDGSLPEGLRHRMASSSLRLAPLTLRRPTDPASIGEQLAASVLAFERETQRSRGLR